jgi:hypothetical protein
LTLLTRLADEALQPLSALARHGVKPLAWNSLNLSCRTTAGGFNSTYVSWLSISAHFRALSPTVGTRSGFTHDWMSSPASTVRYTGASECSITGASISARATDIVFHKEADLAVIYDNLVRTAIHTIKPDHMATFLGCKLNSQYEGEMGKRFDVRIEGTRIRPPGRSLSSCTTSSGSFSGSRPR